MAVSGKGLDRIILEEIGDEEIDVTGVEEEESSESRETFSELDLSDTQLEESTIRTPTSDQPQKRKHCGFLDTPRKKQKFRQGRPIRSQASMCIINAYNYCEREKDLVHDVLSQSYSPIFTKKAFQSKLNECFLDPVRQVQDRTASILGIRRHTLCAVVK